MNTKSTVSTLLTAATAALCVQAEAQTSYPNSLPNMTLTTPGSVIKVKPSAQFNYNVTLTDQDTQSQGVLVNDGSIHLEGTINSMSTFVWSPNGQNSSGAVIYTFSGTAKSQTGTYLDQFRGYDDAASGAPLAYQDSSVGAAQQVQITTMS